MNCHIMRDQSEDALLPAQASMQLFGKAAVC